MLVAAPATACAPAGKPRKPRTPRGLRGLGLVQIGDRLRRQQGGNIHGDRWTDRYQKESVGTGRHLKGCKLTHFSLFAIDATIPLLLRPPSGPVVSHSHELKSSASSCPANQVQAHERVYSGHASGALVSSCLFKHSSETDLDSPGPAVSLPMLVMGGHAPSLGRWGNCLESKVLLKQFTRHDPTFVEGTGRCAS